MPTPSGRNTIGPSDSQTSKRLRLTPANLLTMVRILGAPVLLYLAYRRAEWSFLGLWLALLATDFLDGRLARHLKQRTAFGARLDSLADVIIYCSLGLSGLWLKPQVLRAEAILIGAVACSYAISVILGLLKLGRWPSYHTRGAKTAWLLVGLGVVWLFATDQVWPLRVALVVATLANLEAAVISVVLPEWRVDVPTVYHAIRDKRPRSQDR